jgi:hypothetical protein
MYDYYSGPNPIPLLTKSQQVNNASTSVSPKTRKYAAIIRRFAPIQNLKICYHATYGECAAGTFQKCKLGPDGLLDTEYYPQLCSYLHVKQNPAVVSVLPADNVQTNGSFGRQTVLEPDSAQPWRRPIVTSTVNLAIGELLQLNVDAFDSNDDDDVDIMLTPDSVAPASASLGPRQCCDDDFSQCYESPLGATQDSDVTTTRCETDVNDAATATVASSCASTCVLSAVRKPCRAGAPPRACAPCALRLASPCSAAARHCMPQRCVTSAQSTPLAALPRARQSPTRPPAPWHENSPLVRALGDPGRRAACGVRRAACGALRKPCARVCAVRRVFTLLASEDLAGKRITQVCVCIGGAYETQGYNTRACGE